MVNICVLLVSAWKVARDGLPGFTVESEDGRTSRGRPGRRLPRSRISIFHIIEFRIDRWHCDLNTNRNYVSHSLFINWGRILVRRFSSIYENYRDDYLVVNRKIVVQPRVDTYNDAYLITTSTGVRTYNSETGVIHLCSDAEPATVQ